MAVELGPLGREIARRWTVHKVMQLSAALAYYSIFSIAPLLVIAVSIAGAVFGPDAVRGQLDEQLRGAMGRVGAEAVQSMVQSAYQPGKNIWAAMTGGALLLLGAAGVFGQLKDALNTIWEAVPPPVSGFVGFIRERVVSFSMVLVMGFLMLTSLLMTAVIAGAWDRVSAYLPLSKYFLSVAGVLVSGGVTATLFAFMFKWLPDTRVRWREAWVGAAGTAIMFELGKTFLAVYLGREGASSSYGAAGALVVVLLWVYYTAVILLTGACFTAAYLEEVRKAK